MKNVILLVILWAAATGVSVARAEITFGPGPEDRGASLDSIVAIVNDDIITRRELDFAITAAEMQIRQRGDSPPPREALENQVLERLILNQLQLRATEQNGIVVDDQTVNAAMESIARQNNITLSQLSEILEQDGFSFAKFREQIRNELLTTRLRQKVVESRIQISEKEVDNWLASSAGRIANSEYHLAHILIGLQEGATPPEIQAAQRAAQRVQAELRRGADFSRLAVAVSDARDALEGGDLGWRKIDQIPNLFINAITSMEPGEISGLIRSPSGFHLIKLLEVRAATAEFVTQTRAHHILIRPNEMVSDTDAQIRLERLRERVINGEDFATLARSNSDDTGSAIKGGDLGWINPGEVAPAFERAMDRLQPGQMSDPVQTQFGWHLIQVRERREQEGTEAVQRAMARENLFRRKAEEEWDLWLRRVRDEAYVEVRL